jgi:hypothetical protein
MAARDSSAEPPFREAAIRSALAAIEPIISMLLELGVSCQDASHVVRWAYVHRAASRLTSRGKRPSASRIAAATGLSRADVRGLLTEPPMRSASASLSDRACATVLVGWRNDADFLDAKGNAKALAYAEEGASFTALARKYARDIPPRAMLNELIDSQLVTEVARGRYLPAPPVTRRSPSERDAVASFGRVFGPLGASLLANLREPDRKPAFDRVMISEGVTSHNRARVARDLERRCENFSSNIERYLLDQRAPTDDSIDQLADASPIGVIVACIDFGR